jgi:hypothetical protein
LEKLCFQLEDGRKAADKEIARLLEEVRSVTVRADEEIKAVSRRIETQARLSDARFRGIELNYAGVGGFPVESASMDEECQEEQASLQFSDSEGSEDESGVEKGENSRLDGYEAEGTGCSEVVSSQSEVADVGVGMGSDEESVASKDMASSADMDGEDIGLRGDAEARILL